MSPPLTVHRRIAEVLHEHGTGAVFTLMSEDVAKLTVDIDELGIPLYKTRHDSTAVGMADGYARTSARVGIAMIGRGPALTNALNPLVTAAKARSGLVVLVGETPLDPQRARAARAERMGKYIDQEGALRSVGVDNVVLRDPATVASQLTECLERAARGDVVVVGLPTDLLDASVYEEAAVTAPAAATAVAPSAEDIALVADLLEERWATGRPLILAGAGAVVADAHRELTELGELTGALMATTLLASSYFRGNAFDIGVLGTMSTPLGSELATQAGLVLAFGASLNPYTTFKGDLLRNARVIQFDTSPSAAGRYLEPEMSVVGDAKLAARALVRELERRGARSTGFRSDEIRERIAGFDRTPAGPEQRPDGLDPRAVLRRLNRMLPRERTLIVDGGHHFEFSVANVDVPDPSGFVFANEYFSVGCGLAAALGAAVARPERQAVLVIGDGGFMMNLGDLDTAVRYGLPMVVVVLDDGGFGSEMHYLRVNGLSDVTARYDNPSFARVAEGLGARALSITSVDDLAHVPAALQDLAGPLVLDCKVASSVRAEWVDFLFAAPSASNRA